MNDQKVEQLVVVEKILEHSQRTLRQATLDILSDDQWHTAEEMMVLARTTSLCHAGLQYTFSNEEQWSDVEGGWPNTEEPTMSQSVQGMCLHMHGVVRTLVKDKVCKISGGGRKWLIALASTPAMRSARIKAVAGGASVGTEQPSSQPGTAGSWCHFRLPTSDRFILPNCEGRKNFFDPSTLGYFRWDEADLKTRMICKAVVVTVLDDPAKTPNPDLLDSSPDSLEIWIRTKLNQLLPASMYSELRNAIYSSVVRCELPDNCKPGRTSNPNAWWQWVELKVDWTWIAVQLRRELDRHGRRRKHRALELATSMPYEHIEARLGGFTGTLHEMYTRLMQTS